LTVQTVEHHDAEFVHDSPSWCQRQNC